MTPTRRRVLAGAAGAMAAIGAGCVGSITGTPTPEPTPEPAEYDRLTVHVTYTGAWMATLTYHDQNGRRIETPIDGRVGVETTTIRIPDQLADPGGIEAIQPPVTVEGPELASDGVSSDQPIVVEIVLDGEVVRTGSFTSEETSTIRYDAA